MRYLVLAFALLFSVPARAAYQPWVCPTSLTVISMSGNVPSTPIFTPPSTGWYDIKISVSPASAVALSAGTLTIGYTEQAVARTYTAAGISLASASITALPTVSSFYVDGGIPMTFSITVTLGASYNYHVCYRQSLN